MNADVEAAAQTGDIERLYTLIGNDPHVLENIDKIPFVDTPLHIAAAAGRIRFATEIIRLMPSFAQKLNKQGLSPMHLALQNKDMVRRFVSINKDLVRVKGRKGLTPMHFVAKTEETNILAEFLSACPASIADLTVKGETALHIAVRKRQFVALQLLVGWLWRRSYQLRESIINWKNESGDTILHVSVRMNDAQTVQFLIDNWIKLNGKNSAGSTALDIAKMPQFANADIQNILLSANAKPGNNVTGAPTLAQRLTSRIPKVEKIAIRIDNTMAWAVNDARTHGTLLGVAVFMATMTYQSALSPPGGVYQADASANPTNSTSSVQLNSTTSLRNSTLLLGKSVMSISDFSSFYFVNSISLLVSTSVISMLLQDEWVSLLFLVAIVYYWWGYEKAMRIISPTDDWSGYTFFVTWLAIANMRMLLLLLAPRKISVIKRLEFMGEDKETESILRGNRW